MILLAVLSLLTALRPQAIELRVAPATPRQGQAVFVSASGLPDASRASLTWDDKRYPIYHQASGWAGVIPLNIEERPGRHRIRLVYTTPAAPMSALERYVTVGRTPLRIQRLSMARSTERLYYYPGRKKELTTVGRALRTETARQRWNGNFLVPAHGRISTPWGVKRIRNGRLVGYHRGLDIAAPTGTPIHADNVGRVVLARALTMHGKTVVIDHGLGVTSIFMHQSALRCHEGQTVHRGDVIGEVGSTGVATGPHLHWGVYVHGTAVSPMFWTRLREEGVGRALPSNPTGALTPALAPSQIRMAITHRGERVRLRSALRPHGDKIPLLRIVLSADNAS